MFGGSFSLSGGYKKKSKARSRKRLKPKRHCSGSGPHLKGIKKKRSKKRMKKTRRSSKKMRGGQCGLTKKQGGELMQKSIIGIVDKTIELKPNHVDVSKYFTWPNNNEIKCFVKNGGRIY